jgi:SAM-dependent methyltransferase
MEYEDYDRTSLSYNDTRIPIGLPIILEHLNSAQTQLGEQVLLDAGCGTGNYLAGLVGQLGRLYGLEFNAGMHHVALERFVEHPEVQIHLGSCTDMPFPDETFDGIICTQVLHHLDRGGGDSPDGTEFPNVRTFCREAFRLLRPGGVVLINLSTHPQIRDGFWWAALIPDAIDRMLRHCPSLDQFKQFCQEAGLVDLDVVVPRAGSDVLQGDQYLDPAGPLSPAWRAGDSTWSLATESELSQALDAVRIRLEDGSMDAFLEEREKLRAEIGQTTFLIGRKP